VETVTAPIALGWSLARLHAFDGPRRSGYRTEQNIDADRIQVVLTELDDLVKALALKIAAFPRKNAVLALNHRPPHRALAGLIARDTDLQWNVEEENNARHPVLAGQVEQGLSCLRCERRGIHHTEAVEAQALLDDEIHQCESLGGVALIALVVAHQRPGMVGGDNLRRPEVARRKGGFPARRRPAEHDH